MQIIEESYAWNGSLVMRGAKTTHLILHHAAASNCTAQDIHRWHLGRGWRGIGYNYFVRKDGGIYRGRPEDTAGGHTEGYNSCGIGICFEGNFETEYMSDEQREAGAELVGDIILRYPGISVVCHRDVNATACPGKNFPANEVKEGFMSYERFLEYMGRYNSELAEKEPSGWSLEARDWAESGGIIKGDEQGRKQYKKPLTREEYIVMEYRKAK